MRFSLLIGVALFTGVGLSAGRAQLEREGPLRVESGLLSSSLRSGEDGQVVAYKGIAYAAPPVGDRRWRPPEPPGAWSGVRRAEAFGPAAPQEGERFARVPQNEDCLFLNVWTAARSAEERRPVMVWIHGGGFSTGTGAAGLYDGARLAEAGVVLVTFNYRLNVFGAFAHPLLTRESPHHASGNYGLMDQIAALGWVKRNIAAFGGDPDRVTIFGESAGGRSVSLLMVSPLAEGLFHRAIVQSGPVRNVNYSRASREAIGERIAAALGCDEAPDPLACLRSKTHAELAGALADFDANPIVDGWVIPDDPRRLYVAGRQHTVPLLIGSNEHEATLRLSPGDPGTRSAEDYEATVRRLFGIKAPQVLAVYPAPDDASAFWAFIRLLSDVQHTMISRAQARWMSNVGAPAYFYHFTRVPPDPRLQFKGASHATEIRYVFNTLSQGGGVEVAGVGDPKLLAEADERLAEAMQGYWTQFAATGDPNRPDLPAWPRYDPAGDRYLELGETIGPREGLYRAGLAVLESLMLERYLEPERPVIWWAPEP